MLEAEQDWSRTESKLSLTPDNIFIRKKIGKVKQASSVRVDDSTWVCQKLVSYHVMADYILCLTYRIPLITTTDIPGIDNVSITSLLQHLLLMIVLSKVRPCQPCQLRAAATRKRTA
jgi:hypothetical protein